VSGFSTKENRTTRHNYLWVKDRRYGQGWGEPPVSYNSSGWLAAFCHLR